MTNNSLLKKLGIFLAWRDGMVDDVDVSLLEPQLRKLFSEFTLSEIDSFCIEFYEVFGVLLDQDFPIGAYFGNVSLVSQCMHKMYAIYKTDATKFVRQMHRLMVLMLTTAAGKIYRVSHNMDIENALELFGDEQLDELVADVCDQIVKPHIRFGKKEHLSGFFTRVFSVYVDHWHRLEGLRVRDKMFISYSKDDVEWRKMLVQAIKSYFGQDPPLWYFEENLEFSDSVRQEILEARSKTLVAILLTSNNYFASDPVMKLEYHYFMEQRKRKDVKILWIPCEPSSADLHGLNDVWTPAGKDPLTGKSYHDQKSAFNIAARKLYEHFHPNESEGGS